LQNVNHQVATLAPTLSRLTSTGVFFSASAPADGLPLLPGHVVESVSCANPIMVGEFKDEDGNRYAMIVNLSVERSARVTLKTNAATEPASIISAADGSVRSFDAKEGLWLTAGQGVLLSFKK
jgi:hypothetical protein